MTCKVTKTKGKLINETVDTNIYFACPNVKVQVSLFRERGDFLWIGQDETSKETPSWFGDTPRAVQYVETQLLIAYKNDLINMPVHIKKFLYDYKYSKFYECHHEAAKEMKDLLKDNYSKPQNDLLQIKDGLKSLSQIFEGLYKPYTIISGTMLGWYRHCGKSNSRYLQITFTLSINTIIRYYSSYNGRRLCNEFRRI